MYGSVVGAGAGFWASSVVPMHAKRANRIECIVRREYRTWRLIAGLRLFRAMPMIPQLVKRHPFWTILPTIVAIPVIVFAAWASITLHYTYSSGERAGFLQKLSHKGW